MLFKELTFLGGYWTNNDRNTDKGEVGGSSPPRPTIQITSKYAAIFTFPFPGTCHQKTILPKICQKFESAIDPVIRGVPMRDPRETSKVILPCHFEGRARQCKTLQGSGSSGKSFLVSLRGRSSVG